MHLPCSKTPVGPPRQALHGVSVLPSHTGTSKAPATLCLSKLNHTAFALAVYASCRPLGRRRKTRFGWFAKPCPMGFFIPIEFVRRVSTIASPLPGLSWRDPVSIFLSKSLLSPRFTLALVRLPPWAVALLSATRLSAGPILLAARRTDQAAPGPVSVGPVPGPSSDCAIA